MASRVVIKWAIVEILNTYQGMLVEILDENFGIFWKFLYLNGVRSPSNELFQIGAYNKRIIAEEN